MPIPAFGIASLFMLPLSDIIFARVLGVRSATFILAARAFRFNIHMAVLRR
jgi:hypothetical protein